MNFVCTAIRKMRFGVGHGGSMLCACAGTSCHKKSQKSQTKEIAHNNCLSDAVFRKGQLKHKPKGAHDWTFESLRRTDRGCVEEIQMSSRALLLAGASTALF